VARLAAVRQLKVRGIVIDGPKPVAKLARRPGQMSADALESICRALDHAFPHA
jgi:hypothetical protein